MLHIPTGLAYGALTNLNPIYGLYSTFFPSLIYILFCTSRHLTVGTFAIASIMILSTITRLESKYLPITGDSYSSDGQNENQTYTVLSNSSTPNNTSQMSVDLVHEIRLKIAVSLAFWCGIIQVIAYSSDT